MRSIVVGMLLSSATALAAPNASTSPTSPAPTPVQPVTVRPTLTKIVASDLPQACRDLGKLADSPSQAQALSARISLASCLAEHKLRDIPLCDCEQSVQDIEAEAAQSFALLDEVFTAGDPVSKILARQAQGDLLQGFATRLVATVPTPVDSSQSALALRETRLQLLMPLVNPWFMRAQAAYSELDRIARENPQLAKNPAVVAAVRASRAKLAAAQGGVAKR